MRTYSAPAIFTFHFANAFEEVDPATGARRLHVDMAQYDDPQIINDLHLDLLRTYPGNGGPPHACTHAGPSTLWGSSKQARPG